MMNCNACAAVLAVVALVAGLSGCDNGNGGGRAGAVATGGIPAPTPVGRSLGAQESAVIGAAGGSLVSADKRLTITVPPGALTKNTTLGIEPITDMTRGGKGSAYRLTPHGTVFAQPVTVTLVYGDSDIAGTAAPALTLAFQRADGIWQAAERTVVDTATGTVSVQTRHFSDWVPVPSYVLTPANAVVRAGETVQFQVRDCLAALPDDPSRWGLVPECVPIDENDYGLNGGNGWYVNGIQWGNGTVGRIDIDAATHAASVSYVAPKRKPEPNQVAVSVEFTHLFSGKSTHLVATVTVIDDARPYVGTVHFHRGDLDATATLTWNVYEEQADVIDYSGSGTLEGTLNLPGCDPLPFAVAVAPGSGDDPVSQLSVFNDAATPPYDNAYFFLVKPDPDLMLTLTCGGAPFRMPGAALAAWVDARICSDGSSMPHHSDISHLNGSWHCPSSGLLADWDFVRQ